jgi:hypothetical protein
MPEIKRTMIAGLDLGQATDYTALVVVERTETIPDPPPADPFQPDLPMRLPEKPPLRYALRHLERFHLGTSYPAIVERVAELFRSEPLAGGHLAVDRTGVGRPVVDLLVKAKPNCRLKPITITAGSTVVAEGGGWHIPKKDLVGVLQVLLQGRRLQIAKTLPMAAVLLKELEMFKVKVTLATGHETFEAWRERDHDDLVLSLAMACWVGERGIMPFGFIAFASLAGGKR